MPYAERTTPTPRQLAVKATTLPMPIAAIHNNEERRISSVQSFLRRKCLEYFADDTTGQIGLRCTFCKDLPSNYQNDDDDNSNDNDSNDDDGSSDGDDNDNDTKSNKKKKKRSRADGNKGYIFPKQTTSIHAATVTLQYSHIPYCAMVPDAIIHHMETLRENDVAFSEKYPHKKLKRYHYALVANEMGFTDTGDVGIRFIPPEIHYYGRKKRHSYDRQSAMSLTPASSFNTMSSDVSSTNIMTSPSVSPRSLSPMPPPPAAAVPAQPQRPWTDDDDLLLWNGQAKLGNRWKDVSEQIFNLEFRGDQVRNRWYSTTFKDVIAKKFGPKAYKEAQAAGKIVNYGHGPNYKGGGSKSGSGSGGGTKGTTGPTPAVQWTPEEDLKLWNAQKELGNRWKDIAAAKKFNLITNSAEQIKTRWYSDKFKEFVAKEFGGIETYKAAHVAGRQERSGARPQVEWSLDDDKLLWAARQDLGNKWEDISTQRFEGRMSDNHVKNRWYSAAFKKFVAKEYGSDAYQNAKIGRRGAQSQVDWTSADDLLLWQCHQEMGNKWDVIAKERFKDDPRGINENQVKNRWYSAPFKKFVAEEFGPDAHRNAKHKK